MLLPTMENGGSKTLTIIIDVINISIIGDVAKEETCMLPTSLLAACLDGRRSRPIFCTFITYLRI